MTTILPPKTNVGSQIGRAMGQSFQENFIPAMNQQYQQGRLQKAMQGLDPDADFTTQLKQIMPALATTPGGAQILGDLVSRLGQKAKAKAYLDAQSGLPPNQATQPGLANAPQNQIVQGGVAGQNQVASANVGGQNQGQNIDFLRPQPPVSAGTPFQQRSAGPEPQPELTPQQLQNYANNLVMQSMEAGQPISSSEAMNTAINYNNNIRASNELIAKQKEMQRQQQEKITSNMIARAQNSGILDSNDPEAQTLIGKFANEAPLSPDENTIWEYVRTKYRDYVNHKNSLSKSYSTAGPLTTQARKIFGTYKDKEDAAKAAQPALKFFKENGLFTEAENILTNEVGLGPEDRALWMFPFSEGEKKQLGSIKNNTYGKDKPLPSDYIKAQPGGRAIPKEKFLSLKEDIASLLSKNPEINLVGVRGYLTDEKGYAWTDIDRAFSELQEEGRFKPNTAQNQQLTITKNPPLPGLAQMFKFLWEGTK